MAVMVLTLMPLLFFLISLHLFQSYFWKPKTLRSKLRKQGIDGPPPSSLLGNLSEIKNIRALTSQTKSKQHDSITHGWTSILFPHLELWRNQYELCVFKRNDSDIVHNGDGDGEGDQSLDVVGFREA
ncbi:cytochrome P450 714C2-like protein [Cucumis melo var. makuwa]|uniref:Cytochrome P450 714C2-like protein n=1 Tax=Cucumis melo var. makuwa TaxID=1194695 RepID=A0A5A7T9D9_CUCMM|nr:cytochrome P450 714C2-like protein [Cucumis melo var. makuwa]